MTGERLCGTKCVRSDEPCELDAEKCLPGRASCGKDRCYPEWYMPLIYKNCGDKCVFSSQVCKTGGLECDSSRVKCGSSCKTKSEMMEFGFRDCDGKCVPGYIKCCDDSGDNCCPEGYFSCGNGCRLRLFPLVLL